MIIDSFTRSFQSIGSVLLVNGAGAHTCLIYRFSLNCGVCTYVCECVCMCVCFKYFSVCMLAFRRKIFLKAVEG